MSGPRARGLLAFVLACSPRAAVAAESPSSIEELWASRRAALVAAGFEAAWSGEGVERLRYFRAGVGEPVLLLHGAGDQAGTWAAIAPALAAARRVVVPDLPGHGESPPAEGVLPMAVVVAGAERLLEDATRERPAIVVGNSMGAWLATLLAHRHPERVARLVLVNGGAVPADPGAPSLLPASREDAVRLMALLRDPASPPLPDWFYDDLVRRAPSGPTARMLGDLPGLIAHFLVGRLGEVRVPAELLWGAADRMMTPAYAERMAAALPAARVTLLERCGHLPQLECPERFRTTLTGILALPPVPLGGAEPAP